MGDTLQSTGSVGGPPLKVVFGPSQLLESLPDNTLLISPLNDRWNDFGFRTRVEIAVKKERSNIVYAMSASIGFLETFDDTQNGTDLLEVLLKRGGGTALEPPQPLNFFTMLPDLEAYRKIVRALGVAGAQEVLVAARDVVTLDHLNSSRAFVLAVTETPIFKMSFVRTAEAYFAFKNAGPILRGLQYEETGRLSQNVAIKFKLAGFRNPHELTFAFDHSAELPKRIAIIIGKNGVGKSQMLGRLARSLLRGGEDLKDVNKGERISFNRLLAFAPTSEAESVFPSESNKIQRIRYTRYTLNRSRRPTRRKNVSDIIIQVARSEQTIKERSRWSIFRRAISDLGNPHEICLRTRNGEWIPLDEIRLPTVEASLERYASINSRKDPRRVIGGQAYNLSSGEISFLKFAAQVSLEIENGSLLLFDEPETHLHPAFINQFVSTLDSLLSDTGSAAIIATHSAYFLREVFRDQVSILKVDDDRSVEVLRPTLRTFGADVGAISYFVFGEDKPSYLAEELEKRLVNSGASWEMLYERHKSELSLEFLNFLRQKIEQPS